MPRPGALALFILLIARCCAAADTSALYVESVTVGARDDKARAADIRRALAQVLERAIAPDEMPAKAVGSLLERAADYADQYEYRAGEGAGTPAAGGTLEVSFDRERVDGALGRAGIGVWGEARPELLVWLRVSDGDVSRFIGADEGGALTAALQKAAAKRRVPVMLPLLDLTDQTNLTAADLDAGNMARIRSAVWRYETDVALLGTLVPAGDFQWESRWRFVAPGQTAEWTLGAMGSDEALGSAVDGAFGRLVRLYAPAGRAATTLELRVEGIGSMGDGEACGTYLRGLPGVRSAEWAGADASAVSWRLRIGGSAEVFHRMLVETRRLRPVAAAESSGSSKVYQWVP